MAQDAEQFVYVVKAAAKKAYYGDCIEYMEARLEPAFYQFGRSLLVYYLPRQICELPTLKERRAALASIPENADPKHTKSLVTQGVKILWKKREFQR